MKQPRNTFAAENKRYVDASTGEEIIGVTVLLKGSVDRWAVTGLDGSFSIDAQVPSGTLVCNLIGYKDIEVDFSIPVEELRISMEPDIVTLEAAVVTAVGVGRTEVAARNIEKNSINVVNVMSAKAMELSPDITVANVIRRMSGVTVERNSSGEGQYAILRGMDKRYNYTLVNGVKIPSPDNKNRFVPLDIFPSEMLDRIEVTKSLTANMEGDGIGGAVNLVPPVTAPSSSNATSSLSTTGRYRSSRLTSGWAAPSFTMRTTRYPPMILLWKTSVCAGAAPAPT